MLVRLGLENAIRWSDYDMEVVGKRTMDHGFELFEELRPDVLIMTLRWGGMDGYELISFVGYDGSVLL
ncbi:MAG: hypothetical protein ACLUOI_30475 [Eisenbergiella sp.]